MERLRQPEPNRYYLDLKYISNTHTVHTHDIFQGFFEYNAVRKSKFFVFFWNLR